jgi:superfamily I DNA and/or RNA helicase
MGMLKNEFQKQARFVPVRTLVKRAPQSLQALKPCFMMSPLSLAKFVPPDGLEFDLLVIDEASQMRPEDAFGAFLRCKQVVVVGDAKQLPPTEFFNRAKGGPL